MNELELLQQRVKLLENVLFSFVKSDNFSFQKHITLFDGLNISTSIGTGTKIGTATSQKIGFWNVTPVVQPSTTGATGVTSAGSGTAIKDDTTMTGSSGTTAYTLPDIIKHLKVVGIIKG